MTGKNVFSVTTVLLICGLSALSTGLLAQAAQPGCVESLSSSRPVHGTSAGCMARHEGEASPSSMYFTWTGSSEQVDLQPNGVASLDTTDQSLDSTTILTFTFKMATQPGGNDTSRLMVSTDGGTYWYNFTDLGGIMTPPYDNATRDGYVGPHNMTHVTADARPANGAAPTLQYRWEVTSDGTGTGEYAYLSGQIELWSTPLNPVLSASGCGLNAMGQVTTYADAYDPRANTQDEVSVSANGGAYQVAGYTNGLFFQDAGPSNAGYTAGSHLVYQLTRVDNYGNRSAPYTLPPTGYYTTVNTGKPNSSLIKVDKSGANIVVSWFPQSAQVATTGPVDEVKVYESTSPTGGWSNVATYSGNSNTSWTEAGGASSPITTFYKIVTKKDGVTETDPNPVP